MKFIYRHRLLPTFINSHDYNRYQQIMTELSAKQEFPGGMKYLYLHVKKDLAGISYRKRESLKN